MFQAASAEVAGAGGAEQALPSSSPRPNPRQRVIDPGEVAGYAKNAGHSPAGYAAQRRGAAMRVRHATSDTETYPAERRDSFASPTLSSPAAKLPGRSQAAACIPCAVPPRAAQHRVLRRAGRASQHPGSCRQKAGCCDARGARHSTRIMPPKSRVLRRAGRASQHPDHAAKKQGASTRRTHPGGNPPPEDGRRQAGSPRSGPPSVMNMMAQHPASAGPRPWSRAALACLLIVVLASCAAGSAAPRSSAAPHSGVPALQRPGSEPAARPHPLRRLPA